MNHENQKIVLEKMLEIIETVKIIVNAIMKKKNINMLQKNCKKAANQKKKKLQ